MSSSSGSVVRQETINRHPKAATMPVYDRKMGFILAIIFANEAIGVGLLLPFVGLMVSDFGDGNVNTAGYWSGLLVAMFFVAQIFVAPMWGKMSDDVGRRSVILVGLALGAFIVLCFGFSTNLWMAMSLRFLHGSVNANVVVAKTMTAEVTTAKTEAKGFAVLSGSWAIGMMVGPAVGGLFYKPCESSWLPQEPFQEMGVFCTYPALLPCLLNALYSAMAFTLGLWLLPETNPERLENPYTVMEVLEHMFCFWRWSSKKMEDAATEEGNVRGSPRVSPSGSPSPGVSSASQSEPSTAFSSPTDEHAPSSPTPQGNTTTFPIVVAQGTSVPQCAKQKGNADRRQSNTKKSLSMTACWKDPLIRQLFLNYMAICAPNVALTECFPLYAIADVDHGGLGLSPDLIGLFFAVNGVVGLGCTFLFSMIADFFGRLKLWKICTFGWALNFLMFPLLTPLRPHCTDTQLMIILCILTSPRMFFSQTSFSLSHMFIGNAAPHGTKGAVIGNSQSVAAASRFVFPLMLTPLFAWSIEPSNPQRPWPLNYWLVFVISASVMIVPCISSFFMDEDRVVKKTKVLGATHNPSSEKKEDGRHTEVEELLPV